MIAVRYVAKEEFGYFVLFWVIAQFFVFIGRLALQDISVTKFITSVEEKNKREVVNTAICCKFLICTVIGAGFFLCKPLINYIFNSEQLFRLLNYVPLFFILNSFDDLFLHILQGFHQYKKMAISQVINGAVKLLLIVIFLVLLKMDVLGLIYAFIFSFVASVLFQYLVLPAKKPFNFKPVLFKAMFKFGFPLGLNKLLYFIYSRIDRFMIGAMISPVGVAYYEIASKIPASSGRMFESFRSVFFPNMSELFDKKRYTEAEKVLNNSLRLVSFFIIFAALIATLFQKEIVYFLFSDRYLESAPALSLLMVSLSITIIGTIFGTSLVALGQSDKPVKINLVNTVTNVVGNLTMIPIFGFMGAVYATLVSQSATIPFYVWFLKKGGVRVEFSQYLKPVLAFGVLGIIFLLIKPESIMIKLSFLVLFLIICMLLSIIKKKDISALFEGIRPSTHVIK